MTMAEWCNTILETLRSVASSWPGHLNNPSRTLLNCPADLQANHLIDKVTIMDRLFKVDHLTEFHRAVAGPDVLFAPDYARVMFGAELV